MNLTIHPQAETNFDKRVDALKLCLENKPKRSKTPPKGDSNLHVAHHFDESNILGEIGFSQTVMGRTIGREFYNGDERIELSGEAHQELSRIAEGLRKAITPKNVVTVETLEEILFDWLKRSYLGELIPTPTRFCLDSAQSYIKEGDLWIPITYFHIGFPFKIGNVVFRLITKAFMDNWERESKSKVSSETEIQALNIYFQRLRSELQGTAAGIVSVSAEPAQAYLEALEQTERALSALRFYTHFCISARSVCYSAPMEKQHMDGYTYFVVNDGIPVQHVSGISDKAVKPWNFSKEDFDEAVKGGLDILDTLLLRERLTDFEEKLLDALKLLSKASMAKELSDRLVYTLVAIETVFLRDSNEPIQDKISHRMALLQPVSVSERREIVSNVKKAYALRSKFIHHGTDVSIDDIQDVEKFVFDAWISIYQVIQLARQNVTRHSFFEELDNRMVAG
jgi:hypothetical protein